MEKLFNTVSIVIGIVGGVIIKLMGGFDTALWVLIAMMVLDYISGIIKAVYQKRLSSRIGLNGILKKTTALLVVAAGNLVQEITGIGAIREMVIMFYIANEGISLLENTAAVSNVIPQSLREVLLQLRGDSNE